MQTVLQEHAKIERLTKRYLNTFIATERAALISKLRIVLGRHIWFHNLSKEEIGMEADMTNKTCNAEVWIDRMHQSSCQRPVTVERNGVFYCAIHDPEYIKVKEAKKEVKRKASSCRCGYYFEYHHYYYCPLCGTKRSRKS